MVIKIKGIRSTVYIHGHLDKVSNLLRVVLPRMTLPKSMKNEPLLSHGRMGKAKPTRKRNFTLCAAKFPTQKSTGHSIKRRRRKRASFPRCSHFTSVSWRLLRKDKQNWPQDASNHFVKNTKVVSTCCFYVVLIIIICQFC